MLDFLMGRQSTESPQRDVVDAARMAEIIRYTARTLDTPTPVPFGALIVETTSNTLLMHCVNAVRTENDPSSHAEVRCIRKASRKIENPSLKGYTLYTTCEPCPMCMSTALWAGLDRLVYGATIEDANRHCNQIHIAAEEVNRRSDMPIQLAGPILRDEAYALFTHHNMLRVFATWNPKKK
jgi:tRNA(adenine34) deaminase